jgi:hypothetical protein
MKKLSLVMIVLIFSSLVFASEYEVKGKAGNYAVRVMMDKNPPALGHNNLDIVITDAASKAVTDARVQVEYLMPSFPGRKPMMEYSTTAKPGGNHYLAQIDLSMAGEWTVVVKVTRGEMTAAMEFTFVAK